MKVVSGGQTGVDRAALDAAMDIGLEVGGWCPRGRWAEDGKIPEYYPLTETRSQDIHVRTQRNVETSSATLILSRGAPIGGTRYTVEIAESICRPLLVVDISAHANSGTLDVTHAAKDIATWLDRLRPAVLNIAGPRESGAPGITEQAYQILTEAFLRAAHSRPSPTTSNRRPQVFSNLLSS